MDFEQLLQQIGNPNTTAGWIAQVFVVVFSVMLANFVLARLLDRLHRYLKKTSVKWDDALIDALRKPVRLLVWIVGITFAAQIVQKSTDAVLFEAISPIRDIGVIGTITWFLVRLINSVENNYLTVHEGDEEAVDRTTIDAISKLLRISVIITATLVALQTLGFSISGVLAFGGIGGIAVGFAAKDLLANFFGGLIIYLDRPFAVGDWIRSADKEIEGTVEKIGWRLTCIRSFDKRPIYVPNAVFTSISVQNPSRMTHRRIYETIGIRYDDVAQMESITRDVKTMLQSHPAIDTSQTLMVNFNAFNASSLDFFIYCFTHTRVWTEFHEIKQDVLLKIAEIIDARGAEIAFPTRTLHVPGGVSLQADGLVPAEPVGR
ncbi:MAG: mechanosensitive ion channel family protein [Proteobacteria bacterium]|nr:MAG: mechanosensitive ion channel family protein [Pseudomonadota bacterium]QKK12450.1 MAG: mechanosensitive ion channel family protein [Pseudomonadota bacterium]